MRGMNDFLSKKFDIFVRKIGFSAFELAVHNGRNMVERVRAPEAIPPTPRPHQVLILKSHFEEERKYVAIVGRWETILI